MDRDPDRRPDGPHRGLLNAEITSGKACTEEGPKIEIVPQLGHSRGVNSVAISGKTALSGGDDGTLKLWDLATGLKIRTFEGHSGKVTSVAISPNGKTALSGSDDGTLKLWDLATGLKKFARLRGIRARLLRLPFRRTVRPRCRAIRSIY